MKIQSKLVGGLIGACLCICGGSAILLNETTSSTSVNPTPAITSTTPRPSRTLQYARLKPKKVKKKAVAKNTSEESNRFITPGAYCSFGTGKSKKGIMYVCKEDSNGILRWRRP